MALSDIITLISQRFFEHTLFPRLHPLILVHYTGPIPTFSTPAQTANIMTAIIKTARGLDHDYATIATTYPMRLHGLLTAGEIAGDVAVLVAVQDRPHDVAI